MDRIKIYKNYKNLNNYKKIKSPFMLNRLSAMNTRTLYLPNKTIEERE